MNILLLGGSNTGIWDGWAHHFVILVERQLDAHVTNNFLGAVGSLYGLLQLRKLEQEKAPLPDLIVFEYTLNDIVLFTGDIISMRLVLDTLTDIAEFCVSNHIALQFLCLEPKDFYRSPAGHPSRRIQQAYLRIARRYGLPAPLLQREAMARDIVDQDYLDKHHLAPEASRIVAEALVRRLCSPPAIALAAPPTNPRFSFTFVSARQASAVGRARLARCDMTILKGAVIEMSRPSSTIWPATGRLVAVLFRSRPTSGWYTIRVESTIRRKNACTKDLSLLPEVVTMQYPHLRTRARRVIEIAMPDDETRLMRMVRDHSNMTQKPGSPFLHQELAVFGLMLWSGPSGLDRVADAIDSLRRAIFRGWPWR